ncbi:hypothetical protein Cni_G10027 [Canna indica]|uniref:Uncharacterized protein n=1 Tax=Canna indica TaxID=4628 RepID=A0AAQ3Q6Z3_9LILI|nr:hypothetical protein Cni_G10027 [Canna indica]
MEATPPLPINSRPFAERIIAVCLPPKFKLLATLKAYDGMGDLMMHLEMFRSMMLLNGATDLIFYRTFPTFFGEGRATLVFFPSARVYTYIRGTLPHLHQSVLLIADLLQN